MVDAVFLQVMTCIYYVYGGFDGSIERGGLYKTTGTVLNHTEFVVQVYGYGCFHHHACLNVQELSHFSLSYEMSVIAIGVIRTTINNFVHWHA